MKNENPRKAGSLRKYGFSQADDVWSVEGVSPTIITGGDRIGHSINILEESDVRLLSTTSKEGE